MDMGYLTEKAIKHYKIPIQRIPRLYDYFLDLYDGVYHTRDIIALSASEIGDGDEHEYFNSIREKRQEIIDTISQLDTFKEFDSQDNPLFFSNSGDKTPLYRTTSKKFCFTKRTDVYQTINDGKYFVSIDMEKANFQILKKYNKDIVLGAETYAELIKKFTDSEYLLGSKHMRQIIFGHLSAKRQNQMQRYYTGQILETIIDEGMLPEKNIRIYTHDELVFNTDGYMGNAKKEEIKACIYDKLGFVMHVEDFRLKHVWKTSYVKEYEDGKVVFKGVPLSYFAQVFKKYYDMEVIKDDLLILNNGEEEYLKSTIDGKEM